MHKIIRARETGDCSYGSDYVECNSTGIISYETIRRSLRERVPYPPLSWGSATLPPQALCYHSLRGLLLLVTAIVLNSSSNVRAQRTVPPAKSPVTFAEVPAKVSGIGWVHNNAHSSERHLPETVGAGGAFFDYDNDGWMDIYLVNSGPADFFTPASPLKNALYHNNHDGTFTDVTDKAGVAWRHFWHGRRGGGL